MKITFLGQCGFLLECKEHRIVIDPYLSDFLDVNMSKDDVQWKREFPAPATLMELNPTIVLLSHMHYDHLDPWAIDSYIKEGGKALFVGPYAVEERLRDKNVTNIQFIDEGINFEEFPIYAIPCAHPELHKDESGHYKELSYVIGNGDERIFFGGDMMVYPGLVERVRKMNCKLALLPCNGWDEWRKEHGIVGNTSAEEASFFAHEIGVDAFVPMHHDLFAINSCSTDVIAAEAEKIGIKALQLKVMDSIVLGK